MLKKNPDFLYAIRYLFDFIILFDKRFCCGVSNCLTKENIYSYSTDIAGIKCILKAH